MRLYHYSVSRYQQLLTRRTQGATAKEIEESEAKAKRFNSVGPYIDHISFFFDPIPSRIMGKIYGPTHEFWHPGNRIIEHVVETDMLDGHILFDMVETPFRDAFFDEFVKIHKWDKDDPELLRLYLTGLEEAKRANGEIGAGISNLNRQIKRFVGRTEKAIVAASQDPDFDSFKNKYAANVPHVMIYPQSGRITVHAVNSLTIGSSTRKKIA